MRLEIVPDTALTATVLMALTLGTLDLMLHTATAVSESWTLERITRFFDMGRERNLPTLLSALLLGITAMVAGLAAAGGAGAGRALWILLAAALAWMACDELLELHERINGVLRAITGGGTTGEGRNLDVLNVSLVSIVGAAFVPLLLRIERATAAWLVLGGTLFVTGAVGMEVVATILGTDVYFDGGKTAHLIAVGEEVLEIAGVGCVLRGCLRHLTGRRVEIRFGGSATAGPAPA